MGQTLKPRPNTSPNVSESIWIGRLKDPLNIDGRIRTNVCGWHGKVHQLQPGARDQPKHQQANRKCVGDISLFCRENDGMSIVNLTSGVLRVSKARCIRRNSDETIAESPDDLFFREAQQTVGDPEEG